MNWKRGGAGSPRQGSRWGRLLGVILVMLFHRAGAQTLAQWARSGLGPESDSATSVAVNGVGEVVVTGTFESARLDFGGCVLLNLGKPGATENAFLAKYDPWGVVIWARRLAGGKHDEIARRVGTDAAGNAYVLGEFHSATADFGELTLTNSNPDPNTYTGDLFLAKYDRHGRLVWIRQSRGQYDESAQGLAVMPDGSAVVTGYFDSPTVDFGGVSVTNSGEVAFVDVFIVKYDPDGKALWARQAGGSYNDEAAAVAVDDRGACYVAGSFASPDFQFGPFQLKAAQGKQAFLLKCDANGTPLWAEQAGGDGFDGATGVAANEAGEVYLTGYFTSGRARFDSLEVTNTRGGTRDVFLAKYRHAGEIVWARGAGGSQSDDALDLALDHDGNVVLAGNFASPSANFGAFTVTNQSPAGATDLFVAKYRPDGTAVWAASAKGGGSTANAVGVDLHDNLLVAGDFTGALGLGGLELSNSGWEDFFVARLEADVPELQMTRVGDAVVLSWPTNRPGFVLERTQDPAQSNWETITNEAVVVGDAFVVTNSVDQNTPFFRLRRRTG